MSKKSLRIAAITVFSMLTTSMVCPAASSLKLSGSLSGSVKSNSGIPQMGAIVQLFNRYDRLVQSVSTGVSGDFSFDSLLPDVYSVQVSLASFVPAMKRNIAVQPGMKSILAINLAGLLSSIELVSTGPNSGTLMSDDWKWVLRSTMTTRPVLRFRGDDDVSVSDDHHSAVFSDTRGLLKVSSGETTPYTAITNQPDLATSFALATSLHGNAKLQFTGNIGYGANSSLPSAGFRTTLSSNNGASPEVKLTVQQISLPGRGTAGGQQEGIPALRSLSLTMIDRVKITDDFDMVFGSSLDSITFFDRLNYFSPFAKINYHLGSGKLAISYSSGAPPVELLSSGPGDHGLEQEIAALSVFPRVSLRGGSARVQRSQNIEAGYEITFGSRTFSVGGYREAVTNGALTMMAPDGFYDTTDLLPELSSRSSVFNIGSYRRMGYTASVSQAIGEDFSLTMAYGNGGVLRTDGRELSTGNPDELRSLIHPAQQHWVSGKMAGITPVTHTRYSASYEWMDYRSLTPGHVYLTQSTYAEPGLNVRLRQPIPNFAGLPGRLEASAELRNLLAQGYLGINTADGSRLTLTNAPRCVRGGVSFIF